MQDLDWLPSLRTTKGVEVEAPEEDEEVQALREELEQAQSVKESNSELKLWREERDQSRVDSLILKDELKVCLRSKKSLSQRLCETETNMLAIISRYQEELNLATAHKHKVAEEYARVYAKKEAIGRVIGSLHQEATIWMDRFALTLNGSQELPRLLARAKEMADTYSTPEEIHGLLSYYAITKRAPRHPYRTRSKYRTMGDQEEMRADMSALKEKMASMMDAMLGMRQLMEKNAATAAAISSAAKANPTLPAIAHHPIPDVVGQEKSTLGHISNPHLGYNRVAYPYGLPPNYTSPVIRDDAGHVPPPILEGEPPRQSDEVHEDRREHAQGDIDSHSPFPAEGPAPNALPQPNLMGEPRNPSTQPIFFSTDGPPLAAEERRKLDHIEERLRAVEGFGDYLFADMTDLCLVPDIIILPKFKVPDFDRYKGTTCPKNHLKMYCRKMGAHSRDEKLLMHFFQDSLAGAVVVWYTILEASCVRTWKDQITAFLRQYQYNSDMAPDQTQL
ncbi:hypothetical protein HKD37_19G053170 [Glycine soja]